MCPAIFFVLRRTLEGEQWAFYMNRFHESYWKTGILPKINNDPEPISDIPQSQLYNLDGPCCHSSFHQLHFNMYTRPKNQEVPIMTSVD